MRINIQMPYIYKSIKYTCVCLGVEPSSVIFKKTGMKSKFGQLHMTFAKALPIADNSKME